MARITVVPADILARTTAGRLTELIEAAIADHHAATVSLTGGSTPRWTYEELADVSRPWRARIDWSRVHLFWGDERAVPPDDPESNFGMAYQALVSHVPVPPAQVHRMRGEASDLDAAAAEYAAQLPGTFDVMLLGLGADGHIASLFPGSPELTQDGSTVPVRAVRSPTGQSRLTLTPPVILASRAIVMLVAGEQKADAVATAIEGPLDASRCPAQLVREATDRVEWILDSAAASRLRESDTRRR